ncbi:hypothetical protein N7490_005928 [Penicillium lividum]|nr:hypothetical protein N7490_005928 [Penicillium lividum]
MEMYKANTAHPSRQPSRYRSARETAHTRMEVGGGEVPKNEAATRSVGASIAQSNETNPSIARSMSRYRRNRPSATTTSGATPASSNPTHAPVPVPPLPLSAKMSATFATEEERLIEKHRLDAMEQLTGGSPVVPETKHSYWSRSSQSPKRHSKKSNKDEPLSMNIHETSKGGRPISNPSSTGERKSFLQKVKLSRAKEHTPSNDQVPKYIGIGGGGIVPGTDAPISAINAGERHVRVQYSDTCIDLTITPATLVSDLLLSACDHFPEIDPENFILLESFRQISLERPLRRYEYVRDVMNSWTQDSDNRLIIIPPSSMNALGQVNPQQVPSESPTETTVYVYHSQRPRKWEKRHVTLRADGQIFISKKENSRDHTNICHLSDYDIYSPSARAIAKDIKPPKKICFAIKSQQKSSMFLSTENFVHFFCTNDRATADKWYQTVQQWRSYYLMKKTAGVTQAVGNEAALPIRSLAMNGVSLVDRIPSDAEPLLRVRPSMDRPRAPSVKGTFSHKSPWEHTSPTGPFPETLTLNTQFPDDDDTPLVQRISFENKGVETFAPSGLLGRAYTQRHQAMRERQDNEKRGKQHSPFSSSQLNEAMPPAYSPSAPTNPTTMLSRSKSLSQKSKPLIDLTPVFQEPRQHTRKGRGVTVEPGMALIDAATGPELLPSGMAIPPAVAWRRPSVPEVPPSPKPRRRANTVRSVHTVAQPRMESNSTGISPSAPAVPFLPNSLLASVKTVSPTTKQPTGHGVATGDRNATRPMLDMSPENPFAEGSLLSQL